MSINDEISLLRETIQKYVFSVNTRLTKYRLDEERHFKIFQSCVSENINVFEGKIAIKIGLQIGQLLNDENAPEKVQKLLTSDLFFNFHKESADLYYYKEKELNNYTIVKALLLVILRFYQRLAEQKTHDSQFLFAIVKATLINKVKSVIEFQSTT